MEHQRLTNKEVKKKNRNQIFRYICTHGTVSNPDIVSDLHLSLPTVTNTTRELLESGFCGISERCSPPVAAEPERCVPLRIIGFPSDWISPEIILASSF